MSRLAGSHLEYPDMLVASGLRNVPISKLARLGELQECPGDLVASRTCVDESRTNKPDSHNENQSLTQIS